MIANIEGVVSDVRSASVIVQAGAFGVEVFAPKATLMACEKGSAVRLRTHLVVKEDDIKLYGFHDGDMHTLFTELLTVTGIGPKLALAILSSVPTTLLATAILQGDSGLLAGTPGVGKRTAERIVLELKNKLPESLMAPAGGAGRPEATLPEAGDDAVQALLALGYREGQVRRIVAEICTAEPAAAADVLIKRALAKLR